MRSECSTTLVRNLRYLMNKTTSIVFHSQTSFKDPNRYLITTLPSLFCQHSSFLPFQCEPDQCSNHNSSMPQQTKLFLTSQIVHSTLLRCPSDLIALSFFLWCAQQHNFFHEISAFDWMVSAVRRLTHRCKTVKAVILELESIGCLTKPRTFLLLLRIYWCGRMHDMVFEAYEQMESYGFVPNTFARNVVMDVLFKIGKTHMALRVLKENHAPNFLTFNIALLHLCKLFDVIHIKNVLRVMLRMRYYPNAGTFEMLLNCFCKMNRLVEAYQLLSLMIALGMRISVRVWTMLIDRYCKSGRLDVASNLLEKMIEIGCSPNVVTFTTLFKTFMEFKMVNDAFDLLNIMLSRGLLPDLILCNVLIDCLSKVGKHQEAIKAFYSLSKLNITPDSYTFSSFLSTICLSRKFYLLPELVCRHIEADLVLCNALLRSLISAGYPSLAIEFYDDMIDKGFAPDKYSLAGLLSGLCAARRFQEAVNVYLGVVRNYDDIDALIHTVMIDGLIKAGKYQRAVGILKVALKENCPLDSVTYGVGICALLRGGRIQEACTLYDNMKDNGLTPNVHTCNMMLFFFCKERDLQKVNWMLQEMIDLRIELNDRNFLNLCKFLCRWDTYFSAFSLLMEMRDLGLLSAKALCTLSFDVHAEGVQANYKHYAEAITKWNHTLDSSSSEDLSDVAVSVC